MSRSITVPAPVERLLAAGAALAVSVSGGKDSQAMLSALVRLRAERGWSGPIVAIHADLGRIEWAQTPGHVAFTVAQAGVELVIVRRRGGQGRWDMVDHWAERAETMAARGQQPRPWSDAKNRFCTSDMKRDPINSFLRGYRAVVSAEGIRAEESSARAKKPAYSVRERIAAGGRLALTWNPILDWTADDVWEELGSSSADLARRQALYAAGNKFQALKGFLGHPVYVMGNQRLSCSFCVLGCEGDLRNAARHNPTLLAELVGMERQYGFSFKAGRSLEQIAASAGVTV